MSQSRSISPYRLLGKRLKELRDRSQESLGEAAGAVEIDAKQLASFELGQAKPSQEILLLLISHFGAKDDEAVRLWNLAGYGIDKLPGDIQERTEPAVGISEPAERVLYTDTIEVVVNRYGVIMNFLQNIGTKNPPAVVTRVGMSREHAKSVLQILQMTLNQTEINNTNLSQKFPSARNEGSDLHK